MSATRALLLAAASTALLGVACGGESARACVDPQMIDDMEDGDRFICEAGGRSGAWYLLDDGTSTNISPKGEFRQTLIPDGRGASRYAARFTGLDFVDWGAAMGFSLAGDGAAAQPFDASAAGGIKFWMKANTIVSLELAIPETIPPARGGTCVDSADAWNCDNNFRFVLNGVNPIKWIEYTVPFTALTQDRKVGLDLNSRWGTARWDPSRLMNVQFKAIAGYPFDVWIDDVRFYDCAADECVPACVHPDFPVACPATSVAPATCRPAGTNCAKTLTAELVGLWGTGPNDVWIVGHGGTILHWDGFALTSVPGGGTVTLTRAWGNAPDDVWIVGANGTILHWDGSVWSPMPSGTTVGLKSVWSSGPDDAWAVGGGGTIVHWNGTAWSVASSPTTHNLWYVWGSRPNDVWAVGANTSGAGIVIHWDGNAWGISDAVAPLDTRVVGGTGPDDVWVTGPGGIIHWNGTSWASAPMPTNLGVIGLWALAPDDAWAVDQVGETIRWNGVAWSVVPSGSHPPLIGIWASGPDDAWADGAEGTILHWDGVAWSIVPVEVTP